MAANFVSGSVSVLVKPMLSNFEKDLKSQLASTGLASVGRDIGEDIASPIKDELGDAGKEGGKKAQEEIKKKLKDPLKNQKMSLGSRFKKLGKDAGQQFKRNFGSMIKGGALLAGTALVAGGGLLLKDSITEAGNLEQSMGGVDAVFGKASESIHGFSKQAAQELGLSKDAYNTLATSLGSTLKLGGLDGSALTGETQKLMGFSADLSSLYGGSAEEANTALSAALRGEFEPARKYGLQLSQNAIEQEAVNLGLIKQGEEMSAAAKQTATLSLMYEQGAAATGQFAKESDTLQGKQARAKASFDNLKASIGESLLPVMADLFGYVNDKVLPALEKMAVWVRDELVPAIKNMATWVQENSVWLVPLAAAVGAVVAAVGIWIGIVKIAAAVQLLWNAAMTANPIGLIIVGIAALVAGLVVAYKRSETFRNIVNAVWASIKTAIGFVVDWITGTVWPALQTAWKAIANAAIWLYEVVLLPVWNAIRAAISATVTWIMTVAIPWLQSAWSAIASAAMWLWNSVLKPVWDGIRIAVAIAVGLIMTYIDLLKWYFTNVIAPAALWLWNNVMKPVWNGIKSAIGAVITWFRDTAWPILSQVIAWIRLKFEQFKLGLQIIWNDLKARIINPVIVWFQTVVRPIISRVVGWIRTKFEQFKLGLQIIWSAIRNRIINPIIAWFRDVAWPILSGVIDRIKNGFQSLRNRISTIWNNIRYNVVAPVIGWFEDKVLGRITTFVEKVKNAFTGMKDAIGTAFEQIKGKVRGPVEWLIDTVVNDSIIDNINSVLTTFGMKDKHIKPVSLPKGFATGGYTGPGSKYQPAGVVHADEYVIRKESQNSLRRSAPGFLDSLNRYGARALDGMGAGYAKGGWVKPFQGSFSQNSPYGMRGGRLHAGVDYPTPTGTPITAVTAGTIKSARRTGGPAGTKVELSTALAGVVAGYHHLSRMLVKAGDQVKAGDVLGYTGNTGRSSGPHLHFSIKRDGSYVNPNPYLSGAGEAGSGGGGFWNPFAGIWDGLKDKIAGKVGDGVFGQVLTGFPKFLIDKGSEWATSALSFWDGDHDAQGGAEQWRDLAKSALKREGQYSESNLNSMIRRINQESGGDPRAVNNWDVNARNGDPSKGLLQTIGSTFRAYRDKSLVNDVFDPLANMVASIRYTVSRYGDVQTGWNRKGGYADGGLVTPKLYDKGGYLAPGLSVIENKTKAPEYILTENQWQAMYEGRSGSRGDITLNQYVNSTDATADRIASGVSFELRRQKITGRR